MTSAIVLLLRDVLVCASILTPLAAQVRLSILPNPVSFNVPFSGSPIVRLVNLSVSGPAAVKYQYTGATPLAPANVTFPNFVAVTPGSGTIGTVSAAEIYIGLNLGVVQTMPPGSYVLQLNFSTTDQTPPATASVLVTLGNGFGNAPTITSVLNAASLQPSLSPGALVSIFGNNFGPPVGATQYNDQGVYPTSIAYSTTSLSANTIVTFGGIPAPITYIGSSQINAVVPYGVSGLKTADVVVRSTVGSYIQSSPPVIVPTTDTSPAIFTATQTGSGQGAILNVDPRTPYAPGSITYNSPSNPAPRGFALVLYATGAGAWNRPIPDGEVAFTVLNPMCSELGLECTKLVNGPLSLTIGGKPATVFYAGTSLYEPWGLQQINAYVPMDAPSGQQPVVLKIGSYDNSAQNVTVAIQ